ncbi:MAG: AraC family transcriptional regulator [Chitinophagaceae bacterium]|nr:AraC family transcriptional regulator [Chitinophagaceae bacterium]
MTISYEALNLGILAPATALPHHIKGTMLSEALLYVFANNETTLAIQQHTTALCTFIIKSINTTQPVELRTHLNQPACLWQALIEGEKINTHLPQRNSSLLKNQLLFSTSPASEGTINISSPGEYTIIEVLMGESFLTEFQSLFPSLFNFNLHSSSTDTDLHQLIDNIRTSRMSGNLWNYFIQSRISDIIFHTCNKIVKQAENPISISEDDRTAINKAAEIIIADIRIHIPIPDLARRLGMNEFKLKKLFPLVHGKTIYAYLIHHRMLKAKEMLLQNHSVKEVAAAVGYRSSDLTMVFIQHFGISPSEVRNANK